MPQSSPPHQNAVLWLTALLVLLAGTYFGPLLPVPITTARGFPAGGLAQSSAFMLIASIFVSPVLEELVFRGLLQRGLLRTFPSRLRQLSLANVVTSAAYAAYHVPHHGWSAAAWVVAPALLFGWIYERNGLLACISTHAGFNLLFVLVGMWRS